jgi:hypothetical protein
MFRRNADSIQGTCNTRVKSFFNFIQLNFNPTFDAGDITRYLVNLTVGSIKLFKRNFFAFTFNMLTGLNQFFEVLAALASDLGIGAQACQPDLAGIGFNVVQGAARGVDFFLQDNFGHDAPHVKRVEERPAEVEGVGTK